MKKATIKDVACLAGVSTASVSRVLHQNGYVAEGTRNRILSAINELSYSNRPGADASTSNKNTTPAVLFFVSPITANMLFTQVLECMAALTQKNGWRFIPHFIIDESPMDILRIIEQQRSSALKGIVFCCTNESFDFMPIRKYLTHSPIPVILVERAPNIYGLNKVMINSREMLFQAVRSLYKAGHRRITYFGVEHPNQYDVEHERLVGFREAAQTFEIEDSCSIYPMTNWDIESGKKAFTDFLNQARELPTAIISSDSALLGGMQILYSRNIRVPEDISLFGIDNTYAPFASPALSSVAFPIKEMCENTMRIIETHEGVDSLPQSVLLSCKLIERDSVRTIKSAESRQGGHSHFSARQS